MKRIRLSLITCEEKHLLAGPSGHKHIINEIRFSRGCFLKLLLSNFRRSLDKNHGLSSMINELEGNVPELLSNKQTRFQIFADQPCFEIMLENFRVLPHFLILRFSKEIKWWIRLSQRFANLCSEQLTGAVSSSFCTLTCVYRCLQSSKHLYALNQSSR